MGASERRKGARGENEVRDLVRAAGWPNARRTFASGAAGWIRSRVLRGAARDQTNRTVPAARTRGLRLSTPLNVKAGGTVPVVATRWNGGEWLAVLELDELLALLQLREWTP